MSTSFSTGHAPSQVTKIIPGSAFVQVTDIDYRTSQSGVTLVLPGDQVGNRTFVYNESGANYSTFVGSSGDVYGFNYEVMQITSGALIGQQFNQIKVGVTRFSGTLLNEGFSLFSPLGDASFYPSDIAQFPNYTNCIVRGFTTTLKSGDVIGIGSSLFGQNSSGAISLVVNSGLAPVAGTRTVLFDVSGSLTFGSGALLTDTFNSRPAIALSLSEAPVAAAPTFDITLSGNVFPTAVATDTLSGLYNIVIALNARMYIVGAESGFTTTWSGATSQIWYQVEVNGSGVWNSNHYNPYYSFLQAAGVNIRSIIPHTLISGVLYSYPDVLNFDTAMSLQTQGDRNVPSDITNGRSGEYTVHASGAQHILWQNAIPLEVADDNNNDNLYGTDDSEARLHDNVTVLGVQVSDTSGVAYPKLDGSKLTDIYLAAVKTGLVSGTVRVGVYGGNGTEKQLYTTFKAEDLPASNAAGRGNVGNQIHGTVLSGYILVSGDIVGFKQGAGYSAVSGAGVLGLYSTGSYRNGVAGSVAISGGAVTTVGSVGGRMLAMNLFGDYQHPPSFRLSMAYGASPSASDESTNTSGDFSIGVKAGDTISVRAWASDLNLNGNAISVSGQVCLAIDAASLYVFPLRISSPNSFYTISNNPVWANDAIINDNGALRDIVKTGLTGFKTSGAQHTAGSIIGGGDRLDRSLQFYYEGIGVDSPAGAIQHPYYDGVPKSTPLGFNWVLLPMSYDSSSSAVDNVDGHFIQCEKANQSSYYSNVYLSYAQGSGMVSLIVPYMMRVRLQ